MQEAYHLCGGGPVLKKVKAGAAFVNPGIPMIAGTSGGIPATTTSMADAWGLALDSATYSTVQGVGEAIVTVDVRPDLVMRALMSGAATEGTGLAVCANTSASTAGTTVTAAAVGTADITTGIVWCTKGANIGQSRVITTWNTGASVVVTVPFLNDIDVGDEFLFCPFNACDAGIGNGNVQLTTLLYQANAIILSGTGGVTAIADLELNGRFDSNVLFIAADHAFGTATL